MSPRSAGPWRWRWRMHSGASCRSRFGSRALFAPHSTTRRWMATGSRPRPSLGPGSLGAAGGFARVPAGQDLCRVLLRGDRTARAHLHRRADPERCRRRGGCRRTLCATAMSFHLSRRPAPGPEHPPRRKRTWRRARPSWTRARRPRPREIAACAAAGAGIVRVRPRPARGASGDGRRAAPRRWRARRGADLGREHTDADGKPCCGRGRTSSRSPRMAPTPFPACCSSWARWRRRPIW